jgi:hypothetical protein
MAITEYTSTTHRFDHSKVLHNHVDKLPKISSISRTTIYRGTRLFYLKSTVKIKANRQSYHAYLPMY